MVVAALSLVCFSLCQFHQVVIAFVRKFQLRLDGSYLVGTETAAIVEAVMLAILLLDARRDDIFTSHVPPFHISDQRLQRFPCQHAQLLRRNSHMTCANMII